MLRRRIAMFERGAYRSGLLGSFIGAAHLLAKLYRINPSVMLEARSMEEQRALFEQLLAPMWS